MSLIKLTLSVDEAAVRRARRYSREHQTSISRLVSGFLSSLPEADEEYTPAVRRLLGVLPADVELEEYRDHLAEKYGQ